MQCMSMFHELTLSNDWWWLIPTDNPTLWRGDTALFRSVYKLFWVIWMGLFGIYNHKRLTLRRINYPLYDTGDTKVHPLNRVCYWVKPFPQSPSIYELKQKNNSPNFARNIFIFIR